MAVQDSVFPLQGAQVQFLGSMAKKKKKNFLSLYIKKKLEIFHKVNIFERYLTREIEEALNWLSDKRIHLPMDSWRQRRHWFDPWVKKIP